jgi:predicted patatin/cPLA2 family phospholipase
MKSCLVLEGGAKRGIYTAGVLDILLENNIITDGVIGVSAGAIHGCGYVSRQIGRGIRYNLKYNDDYRFMSFKSWLKTGNMVDTEFAYHELPEKLDVFDNKTFKNSKTKFYVTCTNLKTGEAEYILCPDMSGKYMDYLRASASMPFLSKIVEIDGNLYLDGGISDSIPLNAAFNLGYDKNIVVQTRPEGYRKKAAKFVWLAKLVYRKFPKFVAAFANRPAMYNQELDDIKNLAEQGKIFVIKPSRFINIKHAETNPEIIKEMYNLGREDAQKHLAALKKFLAK